MGLHRFRSALEVTVLAAICLCTMIHRPAQAEDLKSQITNKDAYIRLRTVLLLASTKDTSAIPALVKTQEDKDWRVRLATAWSLGQIRSTEAVAPLIIALADKKEQVRSEAVLSLQSIGAEAVDPLLATLAHKESRAITAAIDALSPTLDERVFPFIVDALKSKHRNVKSSAALALGAYGDVRAVLPIMAVLESAKSRHVHVLRAASIALGQLRDPRSIPLLIDILANRKLVHNSQFYNQHYNRMPAAEALAKIGKPALEPLVQLLDHKKAEARPYAIRALQLLGDPMVVPRLIEALSHKDAATQDVAVWALGELGDQRAVDPLLSLLGERPSRSWMTRWDFYAKSAQALAELRDPRSLDPILLLLEDAPGNSGTQAELASAASAFSPEILEALLRLMKSDREETRLVATRTLALIEDTTAVGPLLEALKDDSPKIRVFAARALGRIDDGRATSKLITALQDPDTNVRSSAAKSLGQIKDPEAIEPLILALDNSKSSIGPEAALALGEIGYRVPTDAVKALIRVLDLEERSAGVPVKMAAAGALAAIEDPEAEQYLEEAIAKRRLDVVCGAYSYYIIRGVPGSEALLLEALDKYDWGPTAAALRDCGHPLLKRMVISWARENGFILPAESEGPVWGGSGE